MSEPRKIGLQNCEPDLRKKLEGLIRMYNGESIGEEDGEALKSLIADVNKELDQLKANKLDVTVADNSYLNKNTGKVTSSMLDDDLAKTINKITDNKFRTIDDKITYEELASDVTNTIDGLKERLNAINDEISNNNDIGSSNSDSITALSDIVNKNKTEADTKIEANETSIKTLNTNIEDINTAVDALKLEALTIFSTLTMSQMPEDVVNLVDKLQDSEVFTAEEKNKLSNITETSSLQVISAYYTADKDILQHYLNTKYTPIYYRTGEYIILYQYVEDGSGTVTLSTVSSDDLSSVQESIVEDSNYNIASLSKSDTDKLEYCLLIGEKNNKIYFKDNVISQSLSKIVDETVDIEADASVEFDISDKISDALELITVNILCLNENGAWVDACKSFVYSDKTSSATCNFVEIERYTDKIIVVNNNNASTTLKVICTGYAY